MTAVCELSSVRVSTSSRPPTTLVEDVSLAACRGEIVGVVGETGAGKTLTMRALLGLLPRRIDVSGRLTLRCPEEVTLELSDRAGIRRLLGRELAVVLQNPTAMFDPLLRVGAQLIEGPVGTGAMTKEDARRRASLLLERMGFDRPEETQRLYPHELSGGMAQRIAIATALMPRPFVIVLDEPTSALDANLRIQVLEMLRGLAAEQNVALFLISHDLGLVSNYCDTLSVMYAGRIVESGATSDVVGAPNHPYTKALLECSATLIRPLRAPLPVIPGTAPAPGTWSGGCVFGPRCPLRRDVCECDRPVLANGTACHFPLRGRGR
jgi:oligopeptide/dipeptide ABC transporter ATP-binding protein